MTNALIIVDVQNDFCEGGSLAVKGGAEVARRISDFIEEAEIEYHAYDVIIASKDWHWAGSDNGGHISDNPDFVDSWPPHCIAGTPGAEFHKNLKIRRPGPYWAVVLKGQGAPAYSAFEGTDLTEHTLEQILRSRDVDVVDVVGIATDYCVKATALDAQRLGFETTVLADLTASITPEGAEAAYRELTDAGVMVWHDTI